MSEPTIRHSVLTFYKDSQILPNRNFIVESIETYLATLTNFGVDNFQYLRPALEMNIKIHKSEEFVAMLLTNNYNYLKFVQDSKSYYYFIIKKTQRAEETIEFVSQKGYAKVPEEDFKSVIGQFIKDYVDHWFTP